MDACERKFGEVNFGSKVKPFALGEKLRLARRNEEEEGRGYNEEDDRKDKVGDFIDRTHAL